jgi:hypothetical protein
LQRNSLIKELGVAQMKAQVLTIALLAAALGGCTTAEESLTGAAAGATAGALLTNSVGGAVAGAAIAGFGTYLVTTADGKCKYRNSKGQVYKTRCHWR